MARWWAQCGARRATSGRTTGSPGEADDAIAGHEVRLDLRRGEERVDPWPLYSYTNGMKTAVSLPDDIFQAAERQAERTSKSRSQLYAEAIAEYLTRHAPEEVTQAMDRVVERVGAAGSEPFVAESARRVLDRSEW